MGYELNCPIDWHEERYTAKVLLETTEIICRGELKLKIKFEDIVSLSASQGQLTVQTANDVLVIHNGTHAEKWVNRIQNPKSTIEKLGIVSGMSVTILGEAPASFMADIARLDIPLIPFSEFHSDITFLFVDAIGDLVTLSDIATSMKSSRPLWIVYPKGVLRIREVDVISAGRNAGLTDIKVVGFSESLTALKFVLPVSSR